MPRKNERKPKAVVNESTINRKNDETHGALEDAMRGRHQPLSGVVGQKKDDSLEDSVEYTEDKTH